MLMTDQREEKKVISIAKVGRAVRALGVTTIPLLEMKIWKGKE